MSTINSSSKNTVRSAAAFFTFDHFNKKIVGSELNFKKSGIPGSAQYNALMAAMDAHPNYTLSAVAPKKEKQSYKGLNSPLVTEYVEIKGNEEQKAELQQLIDNNEAFPTIRSWFLDNFKAGFTVEKAKREIAEYKLNARKARVRTAVRVKSVKAAPAAETPAVINF